MHDYYIYLGIVLPSDEAMPAPLLYSLTICDAKHLPYDLPIIFR